MGLRREEVYACPNTPIVARYLKDWPLVLRIKVDQQSFSSDNHICYVNPKQQRCE